MANILGSSLNDVIVGTLDADLIEGGAGNDRINGGAGDDDIFGGTGSDILTGDAGNDRIFGEDGNDGIYGGGGNDTIDGGIGDDVLIGDGGNDFLIGGSGRDKLYGGVGNDRLDGGLEDDLLYGEAGDDVFVYRPGNGSDTFVGGLGNDRLELQLTSVQITDGLRADLAAYIAWASSQLTQAGSLANLSAQTSGEAFTFASLGVTISAFEGVTILVDGENVAIETIINRAPTDIILSGSTVVENAAVGTVIGVLTGIDPDAGQSATLTFTLAEPSDTFEIVGNELRVKSGAILDFETAPLHTINVTATDVTGLNRTQTFNVSLGNTDEMSTGGVAIASYTAGTTSAQLTATHTLADPDGMVGEAIFQWQVSNNGGDTWDNIAGATSATYTPGGAALGSLIRVTTAYSDPFGMNVIASPDIFVVGSGSGNTLTGTAGTDVILGLGGNDTIVGFSGADTVDGGTGSDTIRLTATSLDLNNASDAQIINVEAISASGAQQGVVFDLSRQTEGLTITGSNFADDITVSSGADIINAGSGNDRINGFSGNDRINGGSGSDTLVIDGTSHDLNAATNAQLSSVEVVTAQDATAGVTISLANQIEAFSIIGSAFSDVLTGGQGNDVFNDLSDGDVLDGSGGTDTLRISGSLAVLNAAADHQLLNIEVITFSGFTSGVELDLSRQSDSSTITTTGFADVITGSSGSDTINSGSGDDRIVGFHGSDRINGSSGRDRLELLDSSVDLGSAGNDQLVSVEVVTAENASSGVMFSLANQTEAFTITGSAFADTVTGGQGNDVFTDFTDGDVLDGSGGSDTLRVSGSLLALNAAMDAELVNIEILTFSGMTTGVDLDLTRQSDGFVITATGFTDVIVGSSGADVIDAGSGDDRIVGFDGADRINGGNGRDTLVLVATSQDLNSAANAQLSSIEVVTAEDAVAGVTINLSNQSEWFSITGSAHSDVLQGGTGRDTISAGDGDDLILGFTSGDIVNGGAGTDAILLLATSTGLNGASNTQISNVEVVSAADAASAVTIDLNRQNDGFTIAGSAWSDVLTGSSGNDVISGGAGNDTIKGGAGVDAIYGGDGADVFVFSGLTESGVSDGTRDVIMDFASASENPDLHDAIDVSAIDAIQGGSNQAFSFNDVPWNGVGAQFTAAGQLSYQYVTDDVGVARTIISGNVNNNLGADFQIALMGHVNLSANDFIL